MRINIARTSVDADYLLEQAEDYGSREALLPYLIMNQKTVNKLMEVSDVQVDDNGAYTIGDYRVLINPGLHFGDVDIR